MPTYEYENRKTGERFTENLPIHKRNFPCRNSFIRRVISAPKISVISDMGGREDKAREQIMQAAEKGYKEREEKNIKVPDWAKERREKSKQKRQWL
jgi:hypothetical protein|tara:strand:- start:173 stop:460 length:288 start_codon:yes stop_codon:yes gene_type:complete